MMLPHHVAALELLADAEARSEAIARGLADQDRARLRADEQRDGFHAAIGLADFGRAINDHPFRELARQEAQMFATAAE
jgi:hypothetical protein